MHIRSKLLILSVLWTVPLSAQVSVKGDSIQPDTALSKCLVSLMMTDSAYVFQRHEVDELPVYQRGDISWIYNESLAYPPGVCMETGIVWLRFVVDREGHVIDPKVEKGINAELDREVLAFVAKSTWAPGKCGGKPVSVLMYQRVVIEGD